MNLRDLAWQTDNGSEFIGGHDRQGRRTGFPAALGDSQHLRIPPAAHTYQSDVETVHRLVEDEFFDLETFTSRGEFLAKSQTYQLYFNLARPNSHKENQTPWQIIERLAPRSPLQLCLLPPVFLDYYLNDSGGYDVPSYFYASKFACAIFFVSMGGIRFMLRYLRSVTNALRSHLRVACPGCLRPFGRRAVSGAGPGGQSRTPHRFDSGNTYAAGISPI
ncbi:MAG: integrase [Candidatus Acidoferrum typicum]|nr:integrase [Candidatus Acidoferrum typicum]